MGIFLSDDTAEARFTTPIKGSFWDFAIIGVATATDVNLWGVPEKLGGRHDFASQPDTASRPG